MNCLAFTQILTPERDPVSLHIQTQSEAALFQSQLPTIIALSKGCKSAKVIRDLKDIPAGCGSAVLTPTVAVHVLVRVSVSKTLSPLRANLLCRVW